MAHDLSVAPACSREAVAVVDAAERSKQTRRADRADGAPLDVDGMVTTQPWADAPPLHVQSGAAAGRPSSVSDP